MHRVHATEEDREVSGVGCRHRRVHATRAELFGLGLLGRGRRNRTACLWSRKRFAAAGTTCSARHARRSWHPSGGYPTGFTGVQPPAADAARAGWRRSEHCAHCRERACAALSTSTSVKGAATWPIPVFLRLRVFFLNFFFSCKPLFFQANFRHNVQISLSG